MTITSFGSIQVESVLFKYQITRVNIGSRVNKGSHHMWSSEPRDMLHLQQSVDTLGVIFMEFIRGYVSSLVDF